MIVLTDNSHIPYEGGDTVILGVFETDELAKAAMREHYHATVKDLGTNPAWYREPTEENRWNYFNSYDKYYYEFEEFTPNELKLP